MKDAFFDTSFAKTPAGQKLIQKFKNDPRIQQSAANFGIKGDGKFLIMLAARLTPEGEIEWTDVSFLFAMEGEASTYFTSVVPTPLGAVPTVTSFGLKLDAQTGLEMGMDPESSALRISLGKLDTVLKFYARYGVGLNDDLAVQPFGSGGVHVVQPFGSVPALAPVGMTLSAILKAGLHVAYGFGEFDWVWTDIPEYYFWKDYRFCWEKVSKNATVQLVQRQISGDYSADFVSLMNMESEAEVFKSSVSPIAQPQLAVLEDGTRILAWLDYENTRGTADGCAVYYSVCRNGIWSDPVLLDDDGTADASLVMEELNGTVFLAWMDRDCTFGDAYPQTEGEDDFLTDLLSADISVARFDTATGTFTDITVFGAPDTMDSMPVLAAAEGGVALGWRSANETCLSNLAENGFGDFRFAVYQKNDEGTAEQWSQVWTREELPAWYTEEELPADAEEIASYLGSGFAYAAQGDLQAAVFPMEDEESGGYGLYGSFQDGTGWGEPILLADLEESTAIAAISADFAPDGALNIAAASRALNSDGSRSDETELLTLCCDPANDVALLEVDYDRDTLIPGGNLALELYVRNLGPRQANAFRVTVLREGEQLVQEAVYSPVASGAESILSVSCPLPAEEDWGDLSALTVAADPISWEDGDQTNNLEVCSLYLTDVSIEKVYATESMDNQTGKNTTTVSAWVVNRGRDPLTDVTLTLYGDLNRETALATTTISKTMAPGTAELCTMVTDDLSAGDYAVVGAAVTGEENITSNNFDFGTVLGMKLPGMLEIDLHNARRESGRVLADVSIENPGEVEQQVTLIAAAYQGDRMLQALPLGSFTVAGQSILTKTAELGSITGSAKLVLFTLRADGSYTPVAQSVSTSVK